MALTVVIGPPAGGKSTWVLEHAQPGDIVIDFDRLAVALSGPGGDPHDHPSAVAAVAKAARNAATETALRHAGNVDVYVIHSNPGRQRMADYQAAGAKVVTIDPGRAVVRERAKRERPQRMLIAIDEWYQRVKAEAQPSGSTRSAAPMHAFPEVTSRHW